MDFEQIFQKGSFRSLLRTAFSNGIVRRAALPFVEKKMWHTIVENNTDEFPLQVRRDRYDIGIATLYSVARSIDRGLISREVLGRLFETLLDNVVLSDQRQHAIDRLGFEPPLFILVSPGKRCNLRCTGCYASSDSRSAA